MGLLSSTRRARERRPELSSRSVRKSISNEVRPVAPSSSSFFSSSSSIFFFISQPRPATSPSPLQRFRKRTSTNHLRWNKRAGKSKSGDHLLDPSLFLSERSRGGGEEEEEEEESSRESEEFPSPAAASVLFSPARVASRSRGRETGTRKQSARRASSFFRGETRGVSF